MYFWCKNPYALTLQKAKKLLSGMFSFFNKSYLHHSRMFKAHRSYIRNYHHKNNKVYQLRFPSYLLRVRLGCSKRGKKIIPQDIFQSEGDKQDFRHLSMFFPLLLLFSLVYCLIQAATLLLNTSSTSSAARLTREKKFVYNISDGSDVITNI